MVLRSLGSSKLGFLFGCLRFTTSTSAYIGFPRSPLVPQMHCAIDFPGHNRLYSYIAHHLYPFHYASYFGSPVFCYILIIIQTRSLGSSSHGIYWYTHLFIQRVLYWTFTTLLQPLCAIDFPGHNKDFNLSLLRLIEKGRTIIAFFNGPEIAGLIFSASPLCFIEYHFYNSQPQTSKQINKAIF